MVMKLLVREHVPLVAHGISDFCQSTDISSLGMPSRFIRETPQLIVRLQASISAHSIFLILSTTIAVRIRVVWWISSWMTTPFRHFHHMLLILDVTWDCSQASFYQQTLVICQNLLPFPPWSPPSEDRAACNRHHRAISPHRQMMFCPQVWMTLLISIM